MGKQYKEMKKYEFLKNPTKYFLIRLINMWKLDERNKSFIGNKIKIPRVGRKSILAERFYLKDEKTLKKEKGAYRTLLFRHKGWWRI